MSVDCRFESDDWLLIFDSPINLIGDFEDTTTCRVLPKGEGAAAKAGRTRQPQATEFHMPQ